MNARLLAGFIFSLSLLASLSALADSVTTKNGDTLWGIAKANGTTVQKLVALNHLTSTDIKAGQQLRLPGAEAVSSQAARAYRVQPGDTLTALAQHFDTSVRQLLELNHLSSTAIKVGQVLTLPGATPSATSQPAQEYRVRAGDTFSALARRFDTSVTALEVLNPGTDPRELHVGETLEVGHSTAPPDPTYTAQKGDTLTSIAKTFEIPLLALQLANPQIGFTFNPGATFNIPVELSRYTVQRGDTLAHIAAGHELHVAAVLAVNPQLHSGQMLEIGHTVYLPKPSADDTLRAEIVAIARRYLGYPYAEVGDNPKQGFSCVGFTHWVYTELGFNIPGNLWGQYGAFPKVSRDDLQPGDIVFFKNTVWKGLSHAALYIGGGKIIHAVNFHYGVKVGSLSQPYYKSRYLGAVDPLSTLGATGVVAATGP